jgi:hypothetical protein
MNLPIPLALARLAALLLGLAGGASAQVVISEIHYHPVEEPAFDNFENFIPALDLAEDVHEFVELQNAGASAVDLGGWALSGAVDFTFPAGTTLPAGAFKVVAKNVGRLQTVYGIGGALGPFGGKLSNRGDTVRLKDAAGGTVDAVTYSASFPWPGAADAFGAQDRFTGTDSVDFQYKGRSLQRVSAGASSNDPANWLASPLVPGPTPGGPQAVTREVPRPVVVGHSRVQTGDGAAIVLAGNAVTVSCVFSSTASLSAVRLEWFVDGVDATGESRVVTTMGELGGGMYAASVPGQAARSIIRYRFLADRGGGSEVVSPRPDDPALSEVGPGGAREAWHGYFVVPASGRPAGVPSYDLLISTANLARIRANAQQGTAANTATRRVTAASATGLPRARPYVADTDPQWNGTVPAVFSHEGVLHDVHIRFHGSRYHRYQNATDLVSFKLHFPECQPFRERSSWFITEHGAGFAEATTMNRLLGLPASTTRTVSWYFNGNAAESKLEQGEYDREMLDAHHENRQRLEPGSEREENGELYKVVGNRGQASDNDLEGPYTRGDQAPLTANAGWTLRQRYDWTFALQNHAWKGPRPIHEMVAGMWAARGDTPAAATLGTDPARLAATRAWFEANFDVDTTLTSLAMLQWIGIWDDICHNQFFWRRANGKWVRLGWDYDLIMTSQRASQTIYAGEAGFNVFDGTNWWKDSFLKCFRAEFKQRLWELNNSFFDPVNLGAIGLPVAASFAATRQGHVNTQLALAPYTKPARPFNASPASGGVVTGGASLASGAYSHPAGSPHGATRWEIRRAGGDYERPLLRETSPAALTTLPIPFHALTYGETYWWRVTHLDGAGHPSVVSAESSFTWGAATVTPGALVINEILAVNRDAVEHGGRHPDYLEIRNNGPTAYDLSGVSLTDDPALPAKFTFPAGNTVAAGGHLVVWCDRDFAAPGYHSGFGLSADGQTLLLTRGAVILDSVSFGPQAPDLSIGRIADGSGGWTATLPTPGLPNGAAALGGTGTLSVNEWMAAPAYGEDWFELHNRGASPVALGGLYLSDTPANRKITRIPPLSFIAAGGFTRFTADGSAAGGNRCSFKLSAGGESVVLSTANGLGTIASVTFGSQADDVSQGRLPDGGATVVPFATTASPERPNWLPAAVVVNELLARPAAGGADWIELHNPGAGAVAIGGWWLSDELRTPEKYQIPAGTIIPAGGYLEIPASQFGAGAIPFSLASDGDQVCLSAVDGGGNLTGYQSRVDFDASAEGVGFGRVAAAGLRNGLGGAEFWPQSRATPGVANDPPRTGPVIFNELMYHPVDGPGAADVTATEFIELHNPTHAAVDLGGWRLHGDSDFSFPAGVSLPPAGCLLLVGFDPADAAALAGFRASYGLGPETPVHGPFSSKLANNTHRLEIARPDEIAGIARWVMSDRVEYRDAAPWPAGPDGGGTSLQRAVRAAIGNDAATWAAAAPTPGAVNGGHYPEEDLDHDGMPDAWEALHGLLAGVDDGADDADGDGQGNLDEFLAGTHPRDPASRFAITGVSGPLAGSVSITWPGVAGKRYRIRTASGTGGWTTRPETIDCLVTGPLHAAVPTGGAPAFFIRVAVEP